MDDFIHSVQFEEITLKVFPELKHVVKRDHEFPVRFKGLVIGRGECLTPIGGQNICVIYETEGGNFIAQVVLFIGTKREINRVYMGPTGDDLLDDIRGQVEVIPNCFIDAYMEAFPETDEIEEVE